MDLYATVIPHIQTGHVQRNVRVHSYSWSKECEATNISLFALTQYFLLFFFFFCKSQFATNLVGLSLSRVNCKGSWIKRRFIHTYLSWCSRCSNIFRYFLYNVLQLNCECLCVYSRSWIPRKFGTSRILQILRNLINNAELLSSSFEIIFYNSYNSCALYFRSLELSGCF